MTFARGGIAGLALFGKGVRLGAEMVGEVFRIGDAQAAHLLLLLRWTRFAR